MRAMILAAGEGKRMGVLTQTTPKPLLMIAGHYLIEYAILNLKYAGIVDIVINVSYRAKEIMQALGNGERYGVKISYSEEVERLETGGGIFKALPQLGNEPFIVVSSDVVTDFPLQKLKGLSNGNLAHLILVANPIYHPAGDFGLQGNLIDMTAKPSLTYGNIGLFAAEMFAQCEPGYFRLTQVLLPAIERAQVTGEQYQGLWYNVGTPADLEQVNKCFQEDLNLLSPVLQSK